jgi:predicted dehydrogenase
MDPVRYGVIGYGLAGAAFHAPIIAATPDAELAAVVARSAEARDAVTARYPGTRVVSTVAELADIGVDVGVVATPNPTHVPIAMELISMGVAPVVDKPLAPDARTGVDLVASASDAGVSLTCYQNRRWDGDFLTVRALASDGSLGRVHRFESRFERWRPEVVTGWKEQPGPGSGVLYDLGPHVIDQAIQLLGPVAEVGGWARAVRRDAVVPDDAFVELRHDSGAVSHLSVSLVAAAPGPRFRVLGTGGAYLKDGLDPQEAELRAGATPGTEGWGTEPEADWGYLCTGEERRPTPTLPGDYPAFYRQMTRHMRGDGPVPVDPLDSVTVLQIIEAVSEAP